MNWLMVNVCVPRVLLCGWIVILIVATIYILRSLVVSYRVAKAIADTIDAIDRSLVLNEAVLDIAQSYRNISKPWWERDNGC